MHLSYTKVELLRLLAAHGECSVAELTELVMKSENLSKFYGKDKKTKQKTITVYLSLMNSDHPELFKKVSQRTGLTTGLCPKTYKYYAYTISDKARAFIQATPMNEGYTDFVKRASSDPGLVGGFTSFFSGVGFIFAVAKTD